jgi:hypothetical protein
MRQVRRGAAGRGQSPRTKPSPRLPGQEHGSNAVPRQRHPASGPGSGNGRARGVGGQDVQRQAWQWALANQAADGSLPSGREIARRYDRHERWGRLVKRAGTAGQFAAEPGPAPSGPAALAGPGHPQTVNSYPGPQTEP